jgi:hypothetical protein
MELFGLVCVACYCGTALLVAVRLLRLARRTGELPELLIGLSLLGGGAIGYPGTVIGRAAVESAPDLAHRFLIAGLLGLFVSAWTISLCWYAIYHRGEAWARAVLVTTSVLLFVFLVERLAAIAPTYVVGVQENRAATAYLCFLAVQALPFALNATTGLRYHALLRRRVPLGLADPVVANRVWLWSFTSLIVVVQYGYSIALPFLSRWFDAAAVAPLVIGSLGLSIAVFLALAFFPPAAYLRFTRARANR